VQLPKSILGKFVPTVHVRDGSLFIVLKSYFDKSGQEDSRWMTLGAVAAGDDVWSEIEHDWTGILMRHIPPATYMHLTEAVHLRGEFARAKGWDDDKVFGLVTNCVDILSGALKTKYCHFSVTVDMQAYRKLLAEGYQMDSPAELCVDTCVMGIFDWYCHKYQGFDLEAHYYFDIGEPFEPILKAKWERELEASERTETYSFWSHIKHIGPAQMRTTPGIQVADMLAWATNRDLLEFPGALMRQRYQDLILPLRSLTPTNYATWDENRLRKTFKPLVWRRHDQDKFRL
jgi:Protein of unknown function (DUF3800)